MPGVSITDLLGVVSGLVNSVFSILPVQATYTISGTYCEPEVQIASRSNTIQFLAHPATYDRYYVSYILQDLYAALDLLLISVVVRWTKLYRDWWYTLQLGGYKSFVFELLQDLRTPELTLILSGLVRLEAGVPNFLIWSTWKWSIAAPKWCARSSNGHSSSYCQRNDPISQTRRKPIPSSVLKGHHRWCKHGIFTKPSTHDQLPWCSRCSHPDCFHQELDKCYSRLHSNSWTSASRYRWRRKISRSRPRVSFGFECIWRSISPLLWTNCCWTLLWSQLHQSRLCDPRNDHCWRSCFGIHADNGRRIHWTSLCDDRSARRRFLWQIGAANWSAIWLSYSNQPACCDLVALSKGIELWCKYSLFLYIPFKLSSNLT